MYKEHPALRVPSDADSMIIWRYMDFTKFVSLLDRKALFFVKAGKLGDPFEGACTEADIDMLTVALAEIDIPEDVQNKIVDDSEELTGMGVQIGRPNGPGKSEHLTLLLDLPVVTLVGEPLQSLDGV